MFSILTYPHLPHMVEFILKTFGRLPVGDLFLYQIVFLFILYSIIGWLLETAYRSWNARKPVNPGVLTGPLVPLYGAGGLTIILVHASLAQYDFTIRACAYFLILSAVEYVTGEFLLFFMGKRFWDYRECRFHLRGHVCLRFSLAWVVLGFFFEQIILPLSRMMLNHIPERGAYIINITAIIVIIADFALTYDLVPGVARVRRISRMVFISLIERIQSTIQIDTTNASLALRRPLSNLIERRRVYRKNISKKDDNGSAEG